MLDKSIFKIWVWVLLFTSIGVFLAVNLSLRASLSSCLNDWPISVGSPSSLRLLSFSRPLLCFLILITHQQLPLPILGSVIPPCTRDHLLYFLQVWLAANIVFHFIYFPGCALGTERPEQILWIFVFMLLFVCLLTEAFPEETRITSSGLFRVVWINITGWYVQCCGATHSSSIFLFQSKPEKMFFPAAATPLAAARSNADGEGKVSFWWGEPASPARMEKACLAWCPSWVTVLDLQKEALSEEVIATW